MFVIFFSFGFELIFLVLAVIAAVFLGIGFTVQWCASHIYLFLIYIVIKAIVNALHVSFINFLLDIIRSLIVLAFFVYFLGNGYCGDAGYLFDFLFVGAAVIYFSYMPLDKWGEDRPITAQLVSIALLLGVGFLMYSLYGNRLEYYFLDLFPKWKPYILPKS